MTIQQIRLGLFQYEEFGQCITFNSWNYSEAYQTVDLRLDGNPVGYVSTDTCKWFMSELESEINKSKVA